jgi:phosphoglycerate kinase
VRLRTLDDLSDLDGRRVFVRLDLNVPLRDGVIIDDTRVRATMSTLTELIERGASLVVASHLGRPKGKVDEGARMGPVGVLLAELLGRVVEYVPSDGVLTAEVEQSCEALAFEPGRVVLLENLRFDPGEEMDDRAFALRLANLADLYVDDAFGAVHRAHASVSALPRVMLEQGRSAVAGRLLEREVAALSRLLGEPDRPYVAVLGGAKVSDKLATIGSLVERVDALLIGGAMAFTFIAAEGGQVGDSLLEPDRFEDVRAARARADELGVVLQLPEDVVAATEIAAEAPRHTVPSGKVPRGERGLDIGPRAVERFVSTIAQARTILWNGPMGVFELEAFSAGTRGVSTAIAVADAFTVAGGGDSSRL